MMEKPETIAVRALVGETEAEIEERYGRPMSELQVRGARKRDGG